MEVYEREFMASSLKYTVLKEEREPLWHQLQSQNRDEDATVYFWYFSMS